MPELKISFDNAEVFNAAAVQAMNATLTPEVREKLIVQALELAMRPNSGGYGDKRSTIELAFASAVDRVIQLEATKMLTEDAELRAKVQVLLRTTADKVLAADQEKLASRMADAFVQSMRRD